MTCQPLLPVLVLLTSLITDLPLVTIASDWVESTEVQRLEKYNMRSLMVLVLVPGDTPPGSPLPVVRVQSFCEPL